MAISARRVRGDDASVQVDAVQEGRERGDLAPLGRCGDLTRRDRGAVRDRREQVHPRPVGLSVAVRKSPLVASRKSPLVAR